MKETPSTCDCCRLIPLSHLSLDVIEPLSGWKATFAARGVEIVSDDLGRPAIPRAVLGELVAESAERAAYETRRIEAARRKLEEAQRLIRLRPRTPALAAPLEVNRGKPA